eukprot:scaffold109974_cov24-Tisochrysis_lutea.AAC.1
MSSKFSTQAGQLFISLGSVLPLTENSILPALQGRQCLYLDSCSVWESLNVWGGTASVGL